MRPNIHQADINSAPGGNRWPADAGHSDSGEAVWPRELQDKENYTRAGSGDLGAGMGKPGQSTSDLISRA